MNNLVVLKQSFWLKYALIDWTQESSSTLEVTLDVYFIWYWGNKVDEQNQT